MTGDVEVVHGVDLASSPVMSRANDGGAWLEEQPWRMGKLVRGLVWPVVGRGGLAMYSSSSGGGKGEREGERRGRERGELLPYIEAGDWVSGSVGSSTWQSRARRGARTWELVGCKWR